MYIHVYHVIITIVILCIYEVVINTTYTVIQVYYKDELQMNLLLAIHIVIYGSGPAVVVVCIYMYTCYMTITNVPYSYRSYSHHIRIREDKWNLAVMFMWERYPENPCPAWRSFSTKIIAVNDTALAVELTLRFG